ncbi:UNVERIFIED_ORG: energy-coupling factor transporter ATP-binding protein EcfA2 [Variovorax paradoxus]|nr:energy-coupling factor transporter ATP-binding protein EcfA2 [Variovorax paradoxus]
MKVFFGGASARAAPVPQGGILILPSEDRWNDFGAKTLIDIHCSELDSPLPLQQIGRIGFFSESAYGTGVKTLEDTASRTQGDLITVDPALRFITMLPALENYRDLVAAAGKDLARDFLLSINDVVALREFNKAPDWVEQAERSDLFALSFMRSASSYFAYKNAGAILRGLEYEELGRLSQSLKVVIQRAGAMNFTSLRLEFEHSGELPKRMAVIIGKNGVGKSRTLATIASAALYEEGELTDGEGDRALISRLLAFAPTNESESVFPAERKRKPRIHYRRFSLNRSRKSRREPGLSDLVVQVARSRSSIGRLERWDIFFKAVQAIEQPEQLAIPRLDGGFVLLRNLGYGGEQRELETYSALDTSKEPMRAVRDQLYALSSGELSFLKFAAQASLHIENGTLVLLDEPETHLHPNFISRFMLLLDNLLEATGSSAIIATHSAYMVKEVFKEQVTVLRLIDGELQVERPMLQTFGADVGAISYFVFGEDEPTRIASKVQDELLERYESWPDLYARFKDDLSLEYLSVLREGFKRREDESEQA